MTRVLFDGDLKLGEVTDWEKREQPAVYKTFLGKTALLTPANNECSFTSPKPVKRKSKLTILEDGSTLHTLDVIKVVGGTEIVAKIKESKPVKGKK